MVELAPLIVTAIVVLLGIGIAISARKPYNRYRMIDDLMSQPEGIGTLGEEATIRGPVTVTNPAVPERPPPEPVGDSDDPAALWAWRVQRKVHSSGDHSRSRWETVESGVAVGEFTVEQDWEHVRIDDDWLTNEQDGRRIRDPFDSSSLYLGEPEESVLLGELDPLSRFLERLGLTDDDGVLSDWEFTISVGRETMTPDRYQATVVREGDELLVRGTLVETDNGFVLRGTEKTPLLLATGRLEGKGKRSRANALGRGVFGFGLILVGVAASVL